MDEEIKYSLRKISSDLEKIKETAAVQTEQLKNHIRRTSLLEARQEAFVLALKPIEKHVTQVHTVFKVIGFVAVAAGLAKALQGLFW